jgi:glucokinase
MNSTFPRLLGDVGGTNARFAWQASRHAVPSHVVTLPCRDHASLVDAIKFYLAGQALGQPHSAAIGMANPVTGDHVQMTNHHWSFSIAQAQRQLGLSRLLVVNDFTALALSLPTLTPNELTRVGGGDAVAGAPLALIGPGTGLGVSGLVPSGGTALTPLNGEGGHVTLCGTNAQEDAVIAWLRGRFGHASAERALSGPGLVNLYQAVCATQGRQALELDAAQITSTPGGPEKEACDAAVQLFLGLLGTVAGNLALTLGARGGVYIGGGILPRLLDRVAASPLRERFESKGRFRSYLEPIPIFVVSAPTSPALIGAARALDHL